MHKEERERERGRGETHKPDLILYMIRGGNQGRQKAIKRVSSCFYNSQP